MPRVANFIGDNTLDVAFEIKKINKLNTVSTVGNLRHKAHYTAVKIVGRSLNIGSKRIALQCGKTNICSGIARFIFEQNLVVCRVYD